MRSRSAKRFLNYSVPSAVVIGHISAVRRSPGWPPEAHAPQSGGLEPPDGRHEIEWGKYAVRGVTLVTPSIVRRLTRYFKAAGRPGTITDAPPPLHALSESRAKAQYADETPKTHQVKEL